MIDHLTGSVLISSATHKPEHTACIYNRWNNTTSRGNTRRAPTLLHDVYFWVHVVVVVVVLKSPRSLFFSTRVFLPSVLKIKNWEPPFLKRKELPNEGFELEYNLIVRVTGKLFLFFFSVGTSISLPPSPPFSHFDFLIALKGNGQLIYFLLYTSYHSCDHAVADCFLVAGAAKLKTVGFFRLSDKQIDEKKTTKHSKQIRQTKQK
jgi:hypothetical protein